MDYGNCWQPMHTRCIPNEGIGTITFHRDHGKPVVLEDVVVDSVSAVDNRGVVSVENENEDIFHIPFVTYYTVSY